MCFPTWIDLDLCIAWNISREWPFSFVSRYHNLFWDTSTTPKWQLIRNKNLEYCIFSHISSLFSTGFQHPTEVKPIIIQPLTIKTEPFDSRCILLSDNPAEVISSPCYSPTARISPSHESVTASPNHRLAATRSSETPTADLSTSARSPITAPSTSVQQGVDPILLQHVSTLQELVNLQQSRLEDQALTEVIQVYISAVKDIELQRSKSYLIHSDTVQLQASHKLYNDQRLSLIQRASWDISRLKAGNNPVWLKHWSTVTFQSAVSKAAQTSQVQVSPVSMTSPQSTQTFQPSFLNSSCHLEHSK